jgi:glycosyltransferase involved in cell wall biosynthesis
VRFLGNVTDVAPLVGAIDIYLASFPQTAASPIIEAMGAGKPVVVLGSSPDSANNTGPELLGISELTARGEAGYVEIADRLLRNVKTRAQLGQAVLKRFGAEFRPELLGERYKSFLERLPHI